MYRNFTLEIRHKKDRFKGQKVAWKFAYISPCMEKKEKTKKNQSQDYDAQTAGTTICLIQYNILSLAKRLLHYESMGELFKQAGTEALELTAVVKIWGYLLERLSLIADIFEIDMEEILNKIAADNQSITKIIKMKAALSAA